MCIRDSRITAPDRIGAVALKQRFEFEWNQLSGRFRQHEIHPTLAAHHLTSRQKTQHVFAKRGEKVLGGRFGFRAIFQVEQIFFNRSVSRGPPQVRRKRQKFNAFTFRKTLEGDENVVWFHVPPVC